MSSNSVDIEILGREFTVACSEEERQGLLDAVSYLDSKMREIRDAGKIIGAERIAMMAALNITHELLNTKSGGVDVGDIKRRMYNLQNQIEEVVSLQNKLL
jgi:cell division protein ZapA